MTPIGNGIAIIVAAFWLTVASLSAETINVSSHTRGSPVTVSAELHLPAAATKPAPAIIIVHGSVGVSKREAFYAEEFKKLGIASAILDSFTPRGAKSTADKQDRISPIDMVEDAQLVLQKLSQDPRIDSKRIGMIGFSKGGTVVVNTAMRLYPKKLRASGKTRFAVYIALYPWCGNFPQQMTIDGGKLHLLLGSADTYVEPTLCIELAAKIKSQGGNIETKLYDGARHGWDAPGPTNWTLQRAENYSRCKYVETSLGAWKEASTGLIVTQDGRRTPNHAKATAACMKHGAGGGYDPAIALRSTADIKQILIDALK